MARYTAEQEAFRANAPKSTKPRKPWRVRLYGPEGAQHTDYTSSEFAYEHVIAEREQAERGDSQVISIRVLQWVDGDWALYERINVQASRS